MSVSGAALNFPSSDANELVKALFCAPFYLSNLPEADRPANSEAFAHFVSVGAGRGFAFSPFFDFDLYVSRAAGAGLPAIPSGGNVVRHWLDFGLARGVSPTALFNEAFYVESNLDVARTGMIGFQHWIQFGRAEGRPSTRWIAEHESQFADLLKPASFEKALGNAVWTFARLTDIQRYLGNRGRHFSFFNILARLFEDVPRLTGEDLTLAVRLVGHRLGLGTLPEGDAELATVLRGFLQTEVWRKETHLPLFDEGYYRRRLAVRKEVIPGNVPAFFHWLTLGRTYPIVPTPFFDFRYYGTQNKDVIAQPLFEHFINHGLAEGRTFNAIFTPDWYAKQAATLGNKPAFLHYLTVGCREGLWPSSLIAAIGSDASGKIPATWFPEAARSAKALSKALSPREIGLFFSLYAPVGESAEDNLKGFLGHISQSPETAETANILFDPRTYWDRLARHEAKEPRGTETATFHFLKIGSLLRINPSKFFDEARYLAANLDLRADKVWGFEHFISHGIFEGRSLGDRLRIVVAAPFEPRPEPSAALNWRNFWAQHAGAGQADGRKSDARLGADRAAAVLESAQFASIVAQLQKLDPEVGELEPMSNVLLPPYHDPLSTRAAAMRARFRRSSYNSVVCIPWLRTGGADLVACLLASALSRLRPSHRILLLQLDHPHVERRDWVPEGVDLVDISDILSSVSEDAAGSLIFTALTGLAVERVVNVNSRRCWEVIRRFGPRLRESVELYAYLFCWDRTPSGAKVGYPSRFFPECAPHISGLFTDTKYLKSEIEALYLPPTAQAEKLYTLYTPSLTPTPAGLVAEAGAESAPLRQRPRVLWAGRLDRQKRFDLVLDIARSMAEADFCCWGAPLFDVGVDYGVFPKNLVLNPPFTSFEDLPLGDADVWLFTADWEGLPTMLIELGVRGMAIVASAVGGVPEIISHATGWLIKEHGVQPYIEALREAISNPAERVKRAKNLKALVVQRHSTMEYDASVKGAMFPSC